jgi:hypothetical protein
MSNCKSHTKGDGSYWLHDARGIPCCRVCEKCEDEKRKSYRLDVMTNSNYEADEQIEEDV